MWNSDALGTLSGDAYAESSHPDDPGRADGGGVTVCAASSNGGADSDIPFINGDPSTHIAAAADFTTRAHRDSEAD